MNILTAPKEQRGATLLISLILLLLLTILALAAAHRATLQQRMASTLQQQNLAYLFSADGTGIPSWRDENCSNGTNSHYYCAKIEQVACAASGRSVDTSGASSVGVDNGINLTGGSCYRITSKGRFELSTATHQQGYMF